MLDSPFSAEPDVEAPHAGWDLTSVPPWNDADPADQLGELACAVADMVGGVHRAVLAFSGGGARTAVGTAAVSSRVHHIRTELEGVAVAVEALHSGAEDAALAGEESARMCTDLAAEVERGSEVLARVVEAVEAMGAQRERIERLAEQLAEIATFSGVIKEVADKTKLLALNATIEAARAGVHGAAFRVVADEIGKLAADSEAQTRRIASVVAATHSDLDPLREAIDTARVQGDGVADARDARETLRRIGELAEQLTEPAERVAATAEEQLQALSEMSGHMQGSVLAVAEVDEHATQMSAQALGLSSSAEDVYELLRPFWTESFVDRAGEVGRRLASEIGGVLDGVVDSGQGTPGSCWPPARTSTSTPPRTPARCAATGPASRRRTSSATGSSASSPTTRRWCAPTAWASGATCPTACCHAPSTGPPAATWSSRRAASSAASCRPTPATRARSSPSSRSRSTCTASAGAPRSSAGTQTRSPPERGTAPGAATLPAPRGGPVEGCRSG